MEMTVRIFNGAVGKAVAAQHLASARILDGYRMLCIDIDPQVTITRLSAQRHHIWTAEQILSRNKNPNL
jgi:cellulose biosynthesis protein BcsQ